MKKRSVIIPLAIALVAIVAMTGVTMADSAKYPYGGYFPPWVDPHAAVNTVPSVITNSTLYTASASTIQYSAFLPPWVDYHITINPFYAQGPTVLTVTGNVANTLNLSYYKLSGYSSMAENVSYRQGSTTCWYNVTGASLNSILNSAQPGYGATRATFYGSGGTSTTILLSAIRTDSNSIVAFNCPPDGALRNILPLQSPYSSQWIGGLYKIVVA